MTFREFEKKRCERLVARFIADRRPAPHVRPKLDLGFRVYGQSVEIFEIRPRWDDNSQVQEYPVAKATYNRTKQHWKVFWQRADLKWHKYGPDSTAASIEDFLAIVKQDEYGCFFG